MRTICWWRVKVLSAAAEKNFQKGVVLYERMDFVPAIECWRVALAACLILIDAGRDQFGNAAGLRGNLGNALSGAGKLDDALKQYERALAAYQALIDAGHSQFREDAAIVRGNMGTALLKAGRMDPAMEQYEMALAAYQAMIDAGDSQLRANAAGIRGNFGNALFKAGRLEDAMDQYKVALDDYQAMIDAGHSQFRADAAGMRGNLGNALSDAGKLDDATEQLQKALAAYQAMIDAGHSQFCAKAAIARGNLGNALLKAGRVEPAMKQYEKALADYQAMIDAGHSQFRADAAGIRGNLGNALFKADRLEDATDQYKVALDDYQAMIDAGHSQFRAREAMVRGYLGGALLKTGSLDSAMEQFEKVLNTFTTLLQDGQRQHVNYVLNTANLIAQLALRQLTANTSPVGEEMSDFDIPKARTSLLSAMKVLAHFPSITVDIERHAALESTMTTLEEGWKATAQLSLSVPTLSEVVLNVCAAWLEQVAELLVHGRPDFLSEQFDCSIEPMLKKVLDILLQNGTAALVTSWHLCTQGLRAQRQALADRSSTDPELRRLNALYTKVEALDRAIIGGHMGDAAPRLTEPLMPERSLQFTVPFDRIDFGGSSRQISIKLVEREKLWEQLIELKLSLHRTGSLPKTERLDPADLERHVVDLQAASQDHPSRNVVLLLLIPANNKRLVAVWLRGIVQDNKAKPNYREALHIFEDQKTEGELRDALDKLTTNAIKVQRAVRGNVVDPAESTAATVAGQSPMTEDELIKLRTEWLAIPYQLTELLSALKGDGVQEVHVVPGGDLHLVPWAAQLDEVVPGLRVRQFPTTGSWWRVNGEASNAPEPISWAGLAHDAAGTPDELLWVGAEAAALQQIWGTPLAGGNAAFELLDTVAPQWPIRDQGQHDVHALVGIGHGHAPEGNWALAGMITGTGPGMAQGKPKYRYFTGMDLHKIKEAKHIVMSCCVLGRVKDSQGEPIGMTAMAFGFKARIAVGAMVPIPDFEGALFSMALHFAWAQAEKTGLANGQHLDWSGVFHATRRTIMGGNWPAGFDAWLLNGFDDWVSAAHQHELANCADKPPRSYWKELSSVPTELVREVATMTTCLG